jgi:pyocin large subunit-like protein
MRWTIVLLILSLAACETKEHADAELAAVKKAQEAAQKASAHAGSGPAEEIGIPECDEYVRKYESCLDKVPDEARTKLRTAFDEQQKQWRTAARDKFARDGAADQCRSAMATAKQSMSAYGCDF